MKKLFFLAIIFFLKIQTNDFFEFSSNKDYGDLITLNESFIKKLINEFKTNIFFETGTYYGGTAMAAMPHFEKTYTVELHDEIFKIIQNKFAPYENVYTLHGSSPEKIKSICPTIEGNILFWLDAHYSGQGTAHSGIGNSLNFEPKTPDAYTPIIDELIAIKEANISNCTILIDDIRLFGTEITDQEYIGCWGYPTIQKLKNYLLKINQNFEIILIGDILLAYDKYKYNPKFSNTVVACTKTRFYDGYNLTDDELIELELKIINAPENEKNQISFLYDQTTNDKNPLFLHDLWYGLIKLGSKNYYEAKNAFSKIKSRIQQFDKNGKLIDKKINYNHSRIDKYLELCDKTTSI